MGAGGGWGEGGCGGGDGGARVPTGGGGDAGGVGLGDGGCGDGGCGWGGKGAVGGGAEAAPVGTCGHTSVACQQSMCMFWSRYIAVTVVLPHESTGGCAQSTKPEHRQHLRFIPPKLCACPSTHIRPARRPARRPMMRLRGGSGHSPRWRSSPAPAAPALLRGGDGRGSMAKGGSRSRRITEFVR